MFLQIIIGVFILLAWISAAISLKKKKISVGEFILWSGLWFTLLVVSMFPMIPGWISSLLGVGRAVDLVMYASIFLLFLLVFKLFVKLDTQQKELTGMVRNIAINRVKKK